MTPIYVCEMQGTKLMCRLESPPFAFFFVIEVRIEIETAKCLEGAKTLMSPDVFSKGLIYGSPFSMMASESFGFIK